MPPSAWISRITSTQHQLQEADRRPRERPCRIASRGPVAADQVNEAMHFAWVRFNYRVSACVCLSPLQLPTRMSRPLVPKSVRRSKRSATAWTVENAFISAAFENFLVGEFWFLRHWVWDASEQSHRRTKSISALMDEEDVTDWVVIRVSSHS